jgi:dephospho-CoA kinase
MQKQSFVVGLTGGIASGKSTVASIFEKLGVDIIDTDLIARELVAPGQPTLESIVEHFGPSILKAEGELDRLALRKIIFDKPEEKKYLEALLHPLIRAKVAERVENSQSIYCLVVIPLLIETLPNSLVSRILVVDIDPERQRKFLIEREGLPFEELEKIIHSQVDRIERLAKAQDIIHNTGSKQELESQVQILHEQYLALRRQEKDNKNV